MKKAIMIFIFCYACVFADQWTNDNISEPNVDNIYILGSAWDDDFRGGFRFKLNSTYMPLGIDWFVVRPNDLGLENFLSTLLNAVANDLRVKVLYQTDSNDGPDYSGDKRGICAIQVYK